MSKKRHLGSSRIPEVSFAPPMGIRTGLEVLTLAELRRRAPHGELSAPGRPTFHKLLTLKTGLLLHTVDFTSYAVEPGTWLWVRPGQVQQWHDLTQAEGTLILFQPDFLDSDTAEAARLHDPHGPVLRAAAGEDLTALRIATEHLRREFDQHQGLAHEVHIAVLQHLLAALVLRLAHSASPVGTPAAVHSQVFLEFRDAVESSYATVRRVEDYGRLLRYSPRTLSRATINATGLGAKEYLDQRVILEAKRQLAHSGQSAAQIGIKLGFSSASNFSKFFHQRTGLTPLTFREQVVGNQ